jgi:hypothetical protein
MLASVVTSTRADRYTSRAPVGIASAESLYVPPRAVVSDPHVLPVPSTIDTPPQLTLVAAIVDAHSIASTTTTSTVRAPAPRAGALLLTRPAPGRSRGESIAGSMASFEMRLARAMALTCHNLNQQTCEVSMRPRRRACVTYPSCHKDLTQQRPPSSTPTAFRKRCSTLKPTPRVARARPLPHAGCDLARSAVWSPTQCETHLQITKTKFAAEKDRFERQKFQPPRGLSRCCV